MKIQVTLKSDKTNGYYTSRFMYIFYHISLSSYQNYNVSDKNCKKNQNTFSKIVPFMRLCEKNIVERGRPQMTIWRMSIACWIP